MVVERAQRSPFPRRDAEGVIAVFGVRPGLGPAVARRYAQGGYDVALVARRRTLLDSLAEELEAAGANAHVFTADLADTEGVPALASDLLEAVDAIDAIYYAPTATARSSPHRARAPCTACLG